MIATLDQAVWGGSDPSEPLTPRDCIEPSFRPVFRKTEHQFEILAAREAPPIPVFSLGPLPWAGQSGVIQLRTTAAAAAQPPNGCEQTVAAVCATGTPGTMRRFAVHQGFECIKPRNRSAMLSNGRGLQRFGQVAVGGQETVVLQQRQTKPAETMGPARHQHITGLCSVAMQAQRTETAKGCDRNQPLAAGRAITAQKHPTMPFECG